MGMVSRQLLGNGMQTVAWERSADSCLGTVSTVSWECSAHTGIWEWSAESCLGMVSGHRNMGMVSRQLLGNGQQTIAWEWSAVLLGNGQQTQ